jgi:hypothetical protein
MLTREIDSISIADDNQSKRTISFWLGNPADISRDDPVDLIIVSAFKNNYVPTQRSIIGALYRRGLSVADLAKDKAVDLRETTGFWLSRPLSPEATPVGVGRILCFEPHFLGSHPAEVVGTLFRGLFPFLPEGEETKIAMAVIATGALGEEPERMIRALVFAATAWMKRGLPIRELRIMEQDLARAERLTPVFAELKESPAAPGGSARKNGPYDLFLSFAKDDAGAVDLVRQALTSKRSGLRLFDYRQSIDTGKIWQDAIDKAVQSCSKMVAFLTSSYFKSVECKEEINMGRLRHKREEQSFLFPLYVRSLDNAAELPLWLQTVNYIDCREIDSAKLAAAADRLVAG